MIVPGPASFRSELVIATLIFWIHGDYIIYSCSRNLQRKSDSKVCHERIHACGAAWVLISHISCPIICFLLSYSSEISKDQNEYSWRCACRRAPCSIWENLHATPQSSERAIMPFYIWSKVHADIMPCAYGAKPWLSKRVINLELHSSPTLFLHIDMYMGAPKFKGFPTQLMCVVGAPLRINMNSDACFEHLVLRSLAICSWDFSNQICYRSTS